MNKKLLLCFISALATICSYAVELPVLPSDPAFHHGVLPNGVSWYIAVNQATKGMADFVLVQKCGMQLADSTFNPKQVAKDRLQSLPHFRRVSPQKFLSTKGANPGPDGFVQVVDDATIYRFNNIISDDKEVVIDSTLLLLFDIIGSEPSVPYDRKWYAPSDQAIIISGDVIPDKIMAKMYYLSMMVNPGESFPRPEYQWVNAQGPMFRIVSDSREISSVAVSWRMPRTPYEYMNTIQPAIFEMVVSELGYLAVKSVKDNMFQAGLPVADVRWYYRPSSSTDSDERFGLTFSVSREHLLTAVEVTSGTFASISRGNTNLADFSHAKRDYVASLAADIAYPIKTNSSYIERAISSFLYNSSLASVREKFDFYTSRRIVDTLELRLFNNIASAMLSDKDNMTVSCTNPVTGFTEGRLRETFESGWSSGNYNPIDRLSVEDITAELSPVAEKVKVVSRYDNASDSFIWVYSNGFKVVYKKMPTERNLFYSLSLNGGYGNLRDLKQGEGDYLSDYLDLCLINGCRGSDFFQTLQDEGVYMKSGVSLSDMSISGVAPVDKVPLVMNALVSVFNNRENDLQAYDYYHKQQRLNSLSRTVDQRRISRIDSIICPGNRYAQHRNIDALTPDFMDKADQFYREQSRKMNDGVLVLVGDMDETRLRKMLADYVIRFETSKRAHFRSTYRYQPISGFTVYTVKGDIEGIDVVMSAMYPLSAENDLAVRIAGMVLHRRLADALADTGMYLNVTAGTTIYPQERINVMVTARLADPDGFASGVVHTGPIKALSVMRSCFSELSDMEVSEGELAIYKEYVKGQLIARQQDPAWWLEVISRRYIQGKDLYSGIVDKLDIITPAKIQSVLTALSNGSRVEYVTKAR